MYHFTIPMALMDFVPVIFFGVTAVILLADLYNKMGKGAYGLLAAGAVNVFTAGFCKALWKLLYAGGVCDFVVLEKMFLPVNSLGLLFVGMSVIAMLCRKKTVPILSVAPAVFTGSLPFILMMVAGLGGLCAGLSVVAVRMKKGLVMILFILSFVLSMAMGYLSGQDSALAWVNWAEQSVNTISQLCLMLGVIALHRSGLKDWNWEEAK
jgi:hypothetical protein